MSYCKKEGKDRIIFITPEDYSKPSTIKIKEYEGEPGLIGENGEINWNCPCLGGMATGPCGYEFRNAFSCVKNSTADPKGADCFEHFQKMQDCFVKYPKLYGSENEDLSVDDIDDEKGNSKEISHTFKKEENILEQKK
ncbi:hypothetical protein HELRODRAFT_170520 [Helobdella robusta]|uniref:CHCH domain-containing protein n=1 Tax=Helobdella robusta TaxID=6412 RepID=T1F357_HELRO|nr:hypothetical protein HELRODRAFT_170520 [Helobdella robusta]ESO07209.1 hypothetical protein HELRODRAFT_170520 [Helobdella robusta]